MDKVYEVPQAEEIKVQMENNFMGTVGGGPDPIPIGEDD